MYTDFKPFSLMGLPTKITSEPAILSEKDLHAMLKRDFFEELHNKGESVRSEAEKSVVSLSVLKIKLPSAGVDHGEKEADGGCRTPKAVDHKENVPLKCPPPPRKPKSLPSTKRKTQRVLLDLSNEIESLFPPNLLRDFMSEKYSGVAHQTVRNISRRSRYVRVIILTF
ncbi:hypothetical protein Pfo_018195 [Paulownia fortunei]|nr:hypothetical protein Pfo_018195 [Paulownia fortunei]